MYWLDSLSVAWLNRQSFLIQRPSSQTSRRTVQQRRRHCDTKQCRGILKPYQAVDNRFMVEKLPRCLRSGNETNVVVDASIGINFQRNEIIRSPLPEFHDAPDERIRPNDEITDRDVADPQARSTARAEMDATNVAIPWCHKKCISI